MSERNDKGNVSADQLGYEQPTDRVPKSTKDKQQAFFQYYLEGMKNESFATYNEMVLWAYKEAGYTIGGESVVRAKKLLRKHWPEVEKEVSFKIGQGAVLGVHTLINLCQNAKSEQVQLKAAVELLNKGGYNETQKVEFSEKAADEMTSEERNKEIKDLMSKRGLQVVGED